MIARRHFLIASGAVLIAGSLAAKAQQPGKVYRIGFLRTSAPPDAYIGAFRQRLKELGYVEGKNVAFEYRWAGGTGEQVPALAAELVKRDVDIIVTDGATAARSARAATRTIPIVMAAAGDPLRDGLVASLARPGGNITGLTSMNLNLGGKLLDVLKDIIPRLRHVAVVRPAASLRADDIFLKDMEASARALKIRITSFGVRAPNTYESVFRTAIKEGAQAILMGGTPFTSAAEREHIIELAAKNRIPAIYDTRDWADNGGLISYGADRVEMYRQAAKYVDKILRGAKPAELPIEQPTNFELVINMRTAKQLGLTIPQSVLARADKVIE